MQIDLSEVLCNSQIKIFTWNVFSATIAIGQLANIFAALGCSLIWRWLRVQRLRSGWRVTVNVNKLLSMFNDCLRWFQCWAWWTSVKWRMCYKSVFISHTCDQWALNWNIRRMSSTARRLWNSWWRLTSILRTASISCWLPLCRFKSWFSMEKEKKSC